MSDQKREGTAVAAGTALGLGIAAIMGVGLILAYLLFRRRDDGTVALLPAMATPWSMPPGVVQSPAPAALPSPSSTLRTYTLPSITTSAAAFRLATAPRNAHHRVTVRVVAPQGGLAVLSFSASELSGVNSLAAGTMTIPTGQHQEIRLPPGQSLYGKGHIPGVMVSLIQIDAPADAGG